MTTNHDLLLGAEPWAFSPDDNDGLDAFFRQHGFAVLRGLMDEDSAAAMAEECAAIQAQVAAGDLPDRYGTAELISDGASSSRFANYVTHITELSNAAATMLEHPTIVGAVRRWLGVSCWPALGSRFGFVFQDARHSDESSYSRIGWHSDWQSSPHLDMWPATAVTVHLDATSPANGFLRVVPGSHLWATPAPYENVNSAVVPDGAAPWGGYSEQPPPMPMPLGFEKVPGEIGLYANVGDVLFHDCYLWHSAARATMDGGIRRHLRGSWYGGSEPRDLGPSDFVKNAAR